LRYCEHGGSSRGMRYNIYPTDIVDTDATKGLLEITSFETVRSAKSRMQNNTLEEKWSTSCCIWRLHHSSKPDAARD